MHGSPIDIRLIEQAAAGDVYALEQVLQRSREHLLAYVERLLPPDVRLLVDSQDVVHDACFEAFRRIGEFKAHDANSVHRWLATIARHRVTDLVRTQRRAKRGGSGAAAGRAGQAPDESLARLLEELAVYQRTPSRSAMRHELGAALEQALARLPVPLREAVRLRHTAGLPFKEVAERMGRTERAAQQLCTRALRALRDELQSASIYI